MNSVPQEIPEYKIVMRYVYALLKVVQQRYNIPLYTTSIHKLVYFTLATFNKELLLKRTFRYYYYGPFSNDLTYALGILKENDYIKIERDRYGTLYSVSDKDKEVRPLPEEKEVLQTVENLVNSVHEGKEILNDTFKLCDLAKTHALWRIYPEFRTPEKLARKAEILGWDLPLDKIKSYLSILENAGLLAPMNKGALLYDGPASGEV